MTDVLLLLHNLISSSSVFISDLVEPSGERPSLLFRSHVDPLVPLKALSNLESFILKYPWKRF